MPVGHDGGVPSDATSLLTALFDEVPHVMICVKDAEGRYVAANEAFVARTRKRRVRDVLGLRAADLFPADLAVSYEAQDRSLLATGRPARNQLELITDAAGHADWYLSTKVLHHTAEGVPQVVAVSVPVQLARGGPARAGGLRAAIELVRRDFAAPLRVDDLARAAGMSSDRLERAMRQVLAVSPKQYLLRTRLEHVALLLATTDRPISEISASCGFFDQSQLTRQFRAALGLTPGRYRTLARGGRGERAT